MSNKILELRVEYKDNVINKITVLVDFTSSGCTTLSDVRAIYATTGLSGGYMSIPKNVSLSNDLIQQVAAAGQETVDRDKIFPSWKKKYSEIKKVTRQK